MAIRLAAIRLAAAALLAALASPAGAATTYNFTLASVFGSFHGGGSVVVETNGAPAQGEYSVANGLLSLQVNVALWPFTLAADPAATAVFEGGKLAGIRFSGRLDSGSGHFVLSMLPYNTFFFRQGISITTGIVLVSAQPGSIIVPAIVGELTLLALFFAILCGARVLVRRRTAAVTIDA